MLWTMPDITVSNELYIVVLPMIHFGGQSHGLTEQVLTLMPDRNFATRFFQDEVTIYIMTFKNRLKYLTSGHVKSYDFYEESEDDGRVVVRVIQNVE
jgi:hypothetical protein